MNIKKIFLIFILLFSIAITSNLNQITGQNESDLLQPFVLSDFSEGLNTDTPTNILSPKASPFLLNCDIDKNTIKIRKGFKLAYTLPVSNNTLIYSKFVAKYDDGSSEFFVHAGSGVYMTTGENVWTTIVNGISDKYPMAFELFNNNVFMSNGVNNVGVWKFTTKTYAEYPFIPKGRYLLASLSQLLVAGIFENPSSVYFSEIENNGLTSNDWDSSHYLKCGPGDGQIITGLFSQDGRVYVAKEKSVYGLLTSANYEDASIFKYTDLYGSVSNKSISSWQSFKMLLNKYGL